MFDNHVNAWVRYLYEHDIDSMWAYYYWLRGTKDVYSHE